ncbi:MAG: prolipoprotein diacylglyceryl transferase [Planctomycetaceae bacterium]
MPGWNPAYTFWMVLAVLVSWGLGRRSRRLVPLARGERWAIAAGAFSGSMLAARLPFAVAQFAGLLGEGPWGGSGKTILFGMVGGYVGVEAVKGALGLKLKTGDSLAMPVAAGIAVGRIACFVGGCCYGTPTGLPWGVVFHDQIPRHPTQLYEAGFHAVAAVALGWLHAQGWFRLQLIKLYFLVYFAYRFVTEWLRPEPVLAGGLTFYQWSALLFAGLFVVLWRIDQPAARALAHTPRSAPPPPPNPA